ncbi:Tex family protein [Paraferrimonas sedimenticola]|uniref:Transcription accessory protein n=1 Tax=Paraferrimonas sedimenticola TaxID=375674 RepID=A0AA37RW14_9GAMM|nr:Tex family protein [Paraferrimonas sedimenticola]GLP95939.1 transcription accessory protein [Paraferrimonas sedimenticola]
MLSISQLIARELAVDPAQVQASIELIDAGATIPFIARYRKEKTGGLDDGQLRQLASRLSYLTELNERRQVILASIEAQGKLSDALKAQIEQCDGKSQLEDLYLPYKPKRRTKGQMAIEAGLEPLAEQLLNQADAVPEALAAAAIDADKGYADATAVLEGAAYILIERFAEDAQLIDKIRGYLKQNARLQAKIIKGQEKAGAKFRDYFEHSELLAKAPSHRVLAMLRGRNEGALSLGLDLKPAEGQVRHPGEQMLHQHLGLNLGDSPRDAWLARVLTLCWRIKLAAHLETELLSALRQVAEADAIQVFANNLGDLLMAAPAGAKVTMGLDPGLRTGVKVAIVDATGKYHAHTTIFPHAPQNAWDKSAQTLNKLIDMHKVELIAIGNGTGSRETDKLVAQVLSKREGAKPSKVMVSEAGASVYSASESAALELPDLDVTIRGAISIARRLQDPLAELVKIEPKAIGVGQYQHDVSQSQLAQSLDHVVEDCVNAVGVDVNMASAALLSRVAGLSKSMADNIVAHRDENGPFTQRKQLLKVARLGPKAYQQCAGFLRIRGGENPLDSSAVHPEAYQVAQSICEHLKLPANELIGRTDLLKSLNPKDFTSDEFGVPTVTDIINELNKPGRDPRGEFKTAEFKEGIEKVSDLQLDMVLQGVVTNVTNFGAFVDVGVHQDGLVHISSLADKYVDDPRKVIKTGDVVKVKVMEVDVERKRIGLSMRLDEKAPPAGQSNRANKPSKGAKPSQRPTQKPRHKGKPKSAPANAAMGDAFAAAFAKAKKS